MMDKHKIIFLMVICLVVGFIMGMFAIAIGETQLMKDYGLYNCIYNNADGNGFPKNPILIQKIQDECIYSVTEPNYRNARVCYYGCYYQQMVILNVTETTTTFDDYTDLVQACLKDCRDIYLEGD